ncbi:MAG: hypothetical protein IIA54_01340 [Chloroflexi bacterium]|nr:hypothetical protein [Chloroflexota bacterium]
MIAGDLVRPGIASVLLFVGLITLYLLLSDTLGGPATFALQLGIVLMVIGAARWLRRAKRTGGWRLFAKDDVASPEPKAAQAEAQDEDPQIPQAS